MGLFDLFRSRKARREEALLAEARARSQNLALLRSAISTIGGERIAAGSDIQLAPHSAALLVSHIITPRSVVDSDVRLLAGLFAMVAARHFSFKIGTNFEYASTHAVLEVIGLRNRDELATIIANYNKPCVTNADPVAMVGYSVGIWMASPTQENLGFLRGLFSLLFGWTAKERPGNSPEMPRRGARLVDWDGCPAIFGEAGAFAMLKPNSLWVPVDFADVRWSGDVLPEEIWRKRFSSFGELDPPMLDQLLPSLRAQKPTARPGSAPPPLTKPYEGPAKLVNWDNLPGIIGEDGAFAMLEPNSPWVEVDFLDVWWTADVLPEEIWRERFKSFGELDPPMIDQLSPPGPLDPIVRSVMPAASAPPSPALPAGAAGESGSAAPPDTKPYKRPTNLVNWDNRPAIIGDAGAFAMLKPNSPWVEVDFLDVWSTADILSEEAWRERFKRFGELNPPMIDQVSPAAARDIE